MHQCTFCGGEEHIDVVGLEGLVDSGIPGRRPGVLYEMSVYLRVRSIGGCLFETILTGISCSLLFSVYALSDARINARQTYVGEVLFPHCPC